MRKIVVILFISSIWLVTSVGSAGQEEEQTIMVEKFGQNLQKIFKIQKKIERIHPFLKKLYPVAIVEGDLFYVFDLDPSKRRYVLAKMAKPAMIVPEGIRAAFPLDFYENKMACVVSGDVFDDLSGYVMIFHEFVHCAQADCCEHKLKSGLSVAQQAQAANDYMWELNFPFPYEDSDFSEIYSLFLAAASEGEADKVLRCRTFLREVLNTPDYEYMVWEEWKEGFARLIENRIKKKLELEENHGGIDPPYNRVTFYEGGARYISILFEKDNSLEKDIEALFFRMLR
ncbi:MAG TPA: hypothetical protein VMW92_04400 [Candidatus Heimdallarchaeota archaeon]|nr:hypothetical protein [Candidatus Heimdallarchaeota archaeon]